MHSKKAQISEGVTWVVATIAVIIILLFSLFLVSFSTKNREISKDFFSDSLNQKTFLSYLLTKEETEFIFSKIKTDENLDNFNGNLAMKIFNELYKDKYSEIWIGTSKLREGAIGTSMNGIENNFFGKKPSSVVSGAMGAVAYKDSYSSILPLKKKEIFAEAFFSKKG